MLHPQRKTMDLVPLVCLCLLTWSAGTAADHKPVVVNVEQGSDVVLPCSLSTQESLTFEFFEWKKDQKQVFLYNAGDHSNINPTGQDQQFKDRVFHFEDQVKNGSASIKIRNTQLADSGNYTCDFPRLRPPQTFYIKLVVEPVVVKVEQGRDVILPCSLSTQQSLTDGFFEWKKDQKQVFEYDGGGHSNTRQDEQFKGRVFHFADQLRNGNASIKIRNTQLADSGTYTCVFPRLRPPQTFYIKLVVGAKPSVSLVKTDDGVLLQCEVKGASPKPKVEWKDSAGNILPTEEPQVTERGGSYDVILQAPVTKTDTFTCVVKQEEIYHQSSAETYAGPLNGADSKDRSEKNVPEKTSNNWIIGVVIGIVGAVFGIVGAVFGIVGIVLAVRARSERSNTAANRSHGGLSPDNDNSEPNQQRGENNGLLSSPETKSASKDQDNTPV